MFCWHHGKSSLFNESLRLLSTSLWVLIQFCLENFSGTTGPTSLYVDADTV